MNHLKEWAGIGVLAIALVIACVLGLFCLCRMVRTQRRDMLMVVQAFHAIEEGMSPHAWLAGIEH